MYPKRTLTKQETEHNCDKYVTFLDTEADWNLFPFFFFLFTFLINMCNEFLYFNRVLPQKFRDMQMSNLRSIVKWISCVSCIGTYSTLQNNPLWGSIGCCHKVSAYINKTSVFCHNSQLLSVSWTIAPKTEVSSKQVHVQSQQWITVDCCFACGFPADVIKSHHA